MSFRFCVLGSGSSGNASYVEADGYGILLDIGLGPRRIGKALTELGVSWNQVRAVVLTHGHGDHWHDNTFKYLKRYDIPFYCHANQARALERWGGRYADLAAAGLTRTFTIEQPLDLGPLRATPFEVPHDDEPTCGFRIESNFGTLAYAADLGCWSEAIVRQLCDADILAVEFNHDVALERNSGRSPMLIDRVLGDRGHLSNEQGASLVAEVLRRSEPDRVRHLVLLHLSQHCNHPKLARAAAEEVIARNGGGIGVHVARHNAALAVLTTNARRERRELVSAPQQGWLPGWNEAGEHADRTFCD